MKLGRARWLGSFLLLGLGCKSPTRPPPIELLPYQAKVSALPPVEQGFFEEVRQALRPAEQARAASKQWPASLAPALDGAWTQRRHGVYVNYQAIPRDKSRLRWLVLYIEPEPTGILDPPPPDDDEHHTLSDGTGLHVTVWTSPNEGPLPDAVLPFPAEEGWTQRVR